MSAQLLTSIPVLAVLLVAPRLEEANWRRFFSWPSADRLQAWVPDMTQIGLGVALAGLLFLFPDATKDTPNLDRLVAFMVMLAAIGFFWSGVTNRIPGVDAEQKWDEWYDKLRDGSEEFASYVSASFFTYVPNEAWQDYLTTVPIPKVDERPLREWASFFHAHPDDRVRTTFKYAANIQNHPMVAKYRRMAVRTYQRFGELYATDTRGFRDWLEEEEVREGAEPLLVLLAYLEVARASITGFGGRGRQRAAFWSIAEKWHDDKTIEMPRERTQPSLPEASNNAALLPPESDA